MRILEIVTLDDLFERLLDGVRDFGQVDLRYNIKTVIRHIYSAFGSRALSTFRVISSIRSGSAASNAIVTAARTNSACSGPESLSGAGLWALSVRAAAAACN